MATRTHGTSERKAGRSRHPDEQHAGGKGAASRSSGEHDGRQRGEQHRSQAQPLNVGGSPFVRDIRHAVTTKYNQVFLLTDESGNITREDSGYGLYFRDTKYLNRWELRVAGHYPIMLLADASNGYESRLELTNPTLQLDDAHTVPKEQLSIRRVQELRHELTDTITVRNMSQEGLEVDLSLHFGSQFEDMFTIRGAQPGKRGSLRPPKLHSDRVELVYDGADEHRRSVSIAFGRKPQALENDHAVFHLKLPARASSELRITLNLVDEGPPGPTGAGGKHTPYTEAGRHHRFDQALADLPDIETANPLFDRALRRSLTDLRMLATANHEDVYVSAGIPWYVALFGRDSAISAFQTLAYYRELAQTTLKVLARYQGTKDDDYQDEEPGKILHELRVGERANLREIPMIPYYGSVDSTPWFLMLLCAYERWSGDLELFKQMEEHVTRALDWIDGNLASGMKGFLTYGSRSERGLTNQGWKDSGNSIVNADGSLAEPPIALVAVQGYVYYAWCELAHVYRTTGDGRRAEALERKAAALKRSFAQHYWMPDRRFYALAIERDEKLAAVVASNPGQLLFTNMIEADKVQTVADRLLGDDMFCGWGIRTLSAEERAYNPLDYQVGSVWPHDNSLIALGLRRQGLTQHLERVFTGIFDAATQFAHFRLPEVFDGFSRDQYDRPVHYPVACSPQAWAAGSLPLMLQAALGLEPDALNRTLLIHHPHLPAWLPSVTMRGLSVGKGRVDLRYERQQDTTLVAVLACEGDLEVQVVY
jgi:glycogen debranching enzyme